MNKLEMIFDFMETENWLLTKTINGITSVRQVIAVATGNLHSAYLILKMTDTDDTKFCFYEVAYEGKQYVYANPYVVTAETLISAVTKFNNLYSDEFLEVSSISKVKFKNGDIIEINEDEEYLISQAE